MTVLSVPMSKHTVFLKSITVRFFKLLHSLADAVGIKEDKDDGTDEVVAKKTSENGSEPDIKVQSSLFPSRNNVDTSLDFKATVVPCALDLSGLQGPMSMRGTLSDAMEWGGNGGGCVASPPISPRSNSSKGEIKEVGAGAEAMGEEGQKFVCHYCDAEFRIRGYLTRHIKKHAVEKAYHCPFFTKDGSSESRCHSTGGFSRRDTYKTHLRSRHFVYPKGVKTSDRAKSHGSCAHCGEAFENTDVWIQNHIEKGMCSGLPSGYIAQTKNSKKSGKLKMIRTSNGHSRFISSQQSVIEPNVLLNSEAIEATAIVVNEANQLVGFKRAPAITKMSDNRLMLNSDNFKGAPKSKKRSKLVRKGDRIMRTADFTPSSMVSPEETIARTTSSEECITPYNETPLDEIYISMNPTPVEDAALEPVKSDSSASSRISSHDAFVKRQIQPTPAMSYPVADVDAAALSEPFLLPLDLDQSPTNLHVFEQDKISMRPVSSKIEETLDRQMDPISVSERHFRETQGYLNFYNFTFDTKL
ncbi:LAMI_0H03048g1_1 [Lachancea mirantina]|uniref:Transcription factor STP1 n=1 Tax=Lachancea mirantina TaxID=1230905 RepID=A0A1G4KEB6_9SACH|nr:LAMI_0H03048g1_1 [Lachancea mirantina]